MGKGKKRSYSGFTKKTAEHLLLDAGAFFKNFTYEEGGTSNDTFDSAVKAGKLIGATKGGGEFSAVASIRAGERPGDHRLLGRVLESHGSGDHGGIHQGGAWSSYRGHGIR